MTLYIRQQRTGISGRWGTNEISPIYDCPGLPPQEAPGAQAGAVGVVGESRWRACGLPESKRQS